MVSILKIRFDRVPGNNITRVLLMCLQSPIKLSSLFAGQVRFVALLGNALPQRFDELDSIRERQALGGVK